MSEKPRRRKRLTFNQWMLVAGVAVAAMGVFATLMAPAFDRFVEDRRLVARQNTGGLSEGPAQAEEGTVQRGTSTKKWGRMFNKVEKEHSDPMADAAVPEPAAPK